MISADRLSDILLAPASKKHWRDMPVEGATQKKDCPVCGHSVYIPCRPEPKHRKFSIPCGVPQLKNN